MLFLKLLFENNTAYHYESILSENVNKSPEGAQCEFIVEIIMIIISRKINKT